jgi:hypothetical protein
MYVMTCMYYCHYVPVFEIAVVVLVRGLWFFMFPMGNRCILQSIALYMRLECTLHTCIYIYIYIYTLQLARNNNLAR